MYNLPEWSDCCLGSTAEVACEHRGGLSRPNDVQKFLWPRGMVKVQGLPVRGAKAKAGRGGQAILRARAMGGNHTKMAQEGVRKPVVRAENMTELYHDETGTAGGIHDLAGPTRTLSREGAECVATSCSSCSRLDGIP